MDFIASEKTKSNKFESRLTLNFYSYTSSQSLLCISLLQKRHHMKI